MTDRELYLEYIDNAIECLMKAWDILYPIQDVFTSRTAQSFHQSSLEKAMGYTGMGLAYRESAGIMADHRNVLEVPLSTEKHEHKRAYLTFTRMASTARGTIFYVASAPQTQR